MASGLINIYRIYKISSPIQLCAENYHWWWRSFFVSGGSAIYVFAYSVFYFYTKLDIEEFVPTLLYFTYTLMMVVTFWCRRLKTIFSSSLTEAK